MYQTLNAPDGSRSAVDLLRNRGPELWVIAFWVILFVLNLTGYPNLLDNERHVGAYAMDVLQNGNWIAQHDATGEFMSKPPALTWCIVLVSLCTGGLTRFSLYLPSALATLGVALLLLKVGRQHFGQRAALLAALMYLMSYAADRQLTTVRYDGLFAFPVVLGAFAAYRGWTQGKGWLVFWVAVTFANMVKGPLAFLLIGAGLVAAFWERDSGHLFRWNRQHFTGMLLFTVVCGAWLALVLTNYHAEFVGKILNKELVGHALSDGGHSAPGARFWLAPKEALAQFLPWSIIAVFGIVRVFRDSAPDPDRKFVRFLACWFLVSLAVFCVAAHQRGRLIWPLIPALALLAGRELDFWLRRVQDRTLFRWAAIATCLYIAGSALFHEVLLARHSNVKRTLAMKELAETLEHELGNKPPIVYVDAPFEVEYYLEDLRFHSSPEAAAACLNDTNATFVLTSSRAAAQITNKVHGSWFTLYAWPSADKPRIQLLSNRPKLSRQF